MYTSAEIDLKFQLDTLRDSVSVRIILVYLLQSITSVKETNKGIKPIKYLLVSDHLFNTALRVLLVSLPQLWDKHRSYYCPSISEYSKHRNNAYSQTTDKYNMFVFEDKAISFINEALPSSNQKTLPCSIFAVLIPVIFVDLLNLHTLITRENRKD